MTKQQELDRLESEASRLGEIAAAAQKEYDEAVDRFIEFRDGEEMDEEW